MHVTLNRVAYVGGATAFTAGLRYEYNRTQLSFINFTTNDAVIKVRPTGADEYKTLTVDTAEFAVLTSGCIDSVEVSGLAEGSYMISALQWNE